MTLPSFSVSLLSLNYKKGKQALLEFCILRYIFKKHVVSHMNLKTGTYLSKIPERDRRREREQDCVVERMGAKLRTAGTTSHL